MDFALQMMDFIQGDVGGVLGSMGFTSEEVYKF